MTRSMTKAHGYCRVSTAAQAESGLGIEAQQKQILAYVEWKLKPAGFRFGQFYCDESVAGGTPFLSREAGHHLSTVLNPGDAVVIAKLDRGFRNLHDCLETVDYFREKQVFLHVLDLNMDTSTAAGMFALQMLGSVAEFESKRISERTKEAMDRKRGRGETWGPAPYPYQNRKAKDGSLVLAYDKRKRKLGQLFLDWWCQGYSVRTIARFCKEKNVRMGDVFLCKTTIHQYIRGELAFRHKEQALRDAADEKQPEGDNPIL